MTRLGMIRLLMIPLLVLSARAQFSGQRAQSLLEELCDFGPRVPASPAAEAAGDWIVSQLKELDIEVKEQRFRAKVSPSHPVVLRDTILASTGLPLRNIIARVPGHSDEQVVLAAHWDSRPFADHAKDPAMRSRPVLGANDAGSGVVVLLELARHLVVDKPAMTTLLVFFDGEDWGREGRLNEYFLGSMEYARTLVPPLPTAGILLDMVGEKGLELPLEGYSMQVAPDLCRRVWSLAAEMGYGHVFQWRQGQSVQDDHLSLIRFGVPMINLIDFDFPEWHTLRDTPDVCSPESMEAVGSVVLQLMKEGL